MQTLIVLGTEQLRVIMWGSCSYLANMDDLLDFFLDSVQTT